MNSSEVPSAGHRTMAEQEDGIREVVFRYQIPRKRFWSRLAAARVFYLALEEGGKLKDPRDEFIERYHGHKPPVRKFSQCTVPPAVAGVRDKETGERGLVFSVSSIEWESTTEVVVEGGRYEHGLSSSRNRYWLESKKGRWQVTRDVMLRIS